MGFPAFDETGDLAAGIYQASLEETLKHFGRGSAKRRQIAQRLARIYEVAAKTGKVAHFIVFGSFVTNSKEPNDVDVFMIMEDEFDVRTLSDETLILFDHLQCQAYFGASVFWVRRLAVFGGVQNAIRDWQLKRDGSKRDIVEITQ